ncbi:2138_t:CDS:10 [Diversispora eburnea]|uniref:2138_t:CDS:1 n=1 Tax=Diversispora eburnea TaxID=1213867 RepID=A0A9N8VGC7_9GLOM|nr:2138_t:CDS:10 [Diversispora eburnea]
MFGQPILTHPHFCFPTLNQKALLSPCGLETLIGITLLTYIIFGIIKWTLLRVISRRNRINDNEEIYNNLRIKGIRGYPKTLNKLVISIQVLVGLEALLNIIYTSVEDQQEQLQSSTSGFQKPIVEDPKYQPPHTLSDFYSKFKKLLPFVWPSHDIKLQIAIVICMLLLVMGRIVNVLLPYRYKGLVDRLQEEEKVWKEIWKEILLFIGLRCLQGDVGLVNTAQSLLWIPVVSVKMFEHLLNLSLRFHLNRKTGEILRVQDRGVSSIVSILSSVIFNIIPTLVDIVIAIVIFTIAFDLFFGMIVFATMSLYIVSTIIMTDWRTKYRRLTNLLDNNMEAKAVDSLLNYETVKLYAAEPFEAILDYQSADQKSNFTLYILNTAQNLIIQCGLLAGCILCASRISKGEMNVGDFVMYLTYILQLYGPLNWFGNYYRVIQKNFVDMEKMLDLLQESPEIKDLPQADPLVIKKGEVIFDNVSFGYNAKFPTLKSISFTIPSGSTVALVGPSGGGKSTIIRLLFRFYDVQSGRILVDGQDIRHVKQQDLRSCIGIVPQDTVLFNDTIKYNIRYGKIGANDRMVEEAARAAQIHDKILGFPEGYGTKVGERGLRLSGGEKQRVNPQIVLLDEATSALDTRTERHIQKSLPHRLSTIVHADQILVLQDGEIVERGSHIELMQKEGVYYKLWNKQLKHHEKVKKEAEIHQQDSGITTKVASSDSASISNTMPSVNNNLKIDV